MTIKRMMLAASMYIPERRSPIRSDTNPISHVIVVAPSVPARKSGVARRIAAWPKAFENRETFVGKTEDVPKPQRTAPRLS